MSYFSLVLSCLSFLIACQVIEGCVNPFPPESFPVIKSQVFSTNGSKLMRNNKSWEFRGTNKMSHWDLNYDEISSWGMDIARECIDMKCSTDYDLQSIVSLARKKGFVVILTAFWYDSDAFPGGSTPYPGCQLLGVIPSQDTRYQAIITRWKQIAKLFANQSDVWFGIWNEPYHWDKTKTAPSSQWLFDTSSMIDSLRETGANNIVVVCGNAMGQGHEPFLEKGSELLKGRKNIVFDIHAYDTYWNIQGSAIEKILNDLNNRNIAPVLIGEFADNGSQGYETIMNSCRNTHTSLVAWLWGQFQEPFYTKFKIYCSEKRNIN